MPTFQSEMEAALNNALSKYGAVFTVGEFHWIPGTDVFATTVTLSGAYRPKEEES